jgi:ABC-type spermidine/putrescine transport system permease subunit II
VKEQDMKSLLVDMLVAVVTVAFVVLVSILSAGGLRRIEPLLRGLLAGVGA